MVKKIIFLFVVVFLLAFIVMASQSQDYPDLGNITADSSVYSCWPSCLAYINLTVNPSGNYTSEIWNMSLNNTADVSASINYGIEWYNGSGWVNQSSNNTFVNGSNYNLTAGTHQFKINISLPSALSTKWNVSFNVNGTDYVLDPYLDSIVLNSPANPNLTNDQTPDFNFTLFSNSAAIQSCTLYTNLNGSGSWTSRGTNSSTINGSSTTITSSTISQGNYTWKITCNVTGNSASRWIYIDDTTAPSITSSISVSASSTSATVSWTTDESANASVNYGTTTSLGTIEAPAGFTTSHSISLTGLSSSTKYYFKVTNCDPYNNCYTSAQNDFTTSAYSSYIPGGGGSVGTQTKTKTWTRLAEGETGTWSLNSKDLGLKQINITVNNESKSVKLSASRILVMSSSIPEKSGEVYRFVKIEANNINGLNRSSMMLQIENTWMENNSFSNQDISMFRFDNSSNKWQKLNTSFQSEDNNYHYFNAETVELSYFAISGEKTITTPDSTSTTDTTSPTDASSTDAAAGSTDEDDEGTSWTGVIIMIIIIAVVAIGVVAFIIYTQLFKKKRR